MSQFCRLGHLNKIFVVKGQLVKKGGLVGTIGTGNGQYSAHLHADFPIEMIWWTDYVFGKTKEQVRKAYADPKPYRLICCPAYDHMGWGYLDYATYGTKHCYHPGEDWNGKGIGNADLGQPIYAPFDCQVVYLYDGTGTNGGWGKLLALRETEIPREIDTVSVPEPIKTYNATTEIKIASTPSSASTQPLPINAIDGDTGIMEKQEVVAENHPEPTLTPSIIYLIKLIWNKLRVLWIKLPWAK